MILLLPVLLFLTFYKSDFKAKNFTDDYLSKEKTLAIKGFFVILVFFRHCFSYLKLTSIIDKPMEILVNVLGQSIVSMFLFYSGYGIYEQIKRKKDTYIKNFPIKRLGKLFLDFVIAIITFIIVNASTGTLKNYSINKILLAFIGWESIGNSNWYMFVTFITYIFVIISFNIFKNSDKKSIILTIILTLIYSVVILKFKHQIWMNTSLCFTLGMLYSYYKINIEEFLKNNKNYLIVGVIISIIYIVLNLVYYKTVNPYIYVVISSIFALIIVMITMKFTINSEILKKLGKNVFWIYILQRIPMMILYNFGMQKNQYIFFVASLVITIIVADIYNNIIDKKLMKYIFEDKQKKSN